MVDYLMINKDNIVPGVILKEKLVTFTIYYVVVSVSYVYDQKTLNIEELFRDSPNQVVSSLKQLILDDNFGSLNPESWEIALDFGICN